ncbi:GNAT family N-acetyltransferase [Inhella proteolytica]|uniref:GNAT family N-acetyltransferase n=1 Tax=Inhella proteolytica TaxID=2795029 RepID=A0A931NEV3_9BURK|nr:GNAT family N-acetyltransferase [Inhella proteolytica]MBH9578102.1 GNAT family N-acetyltransferase [Inhella proteolytica]
MAAHGCHLDADAERRPLYAAWVGPRIFSGTYLGWFAVEGETVLGGAGAVLLDWGPTRANPGGVMARIVNVFTTESHRGKGIARQLLQAVLADCEARGVREFNLGASAAGRGIYRGLGFEPYEAEMRRRCASVGDASVPR